MTNYFQSRGKSVSALTRSILFRRPWYCISIYVLVYLKVGFNQSNWYLNAAVKREASDYYFPSYGGLWIGHFYSSKYLLDNEFLLKTESLTSPTYDQILYILEDKRCSSDSIACSKIFNGMKQHTESDDFVVFKISLQVV